MSSFYEPPFFFACITQQKCQIISHIIKTEVVPAKNNRNFKNPSRIQRFSFILYQNGIRAASGYCALYINQLTSHHSPRGAPYYMNMHGLRTPREEIAFTARPKIHSHSQIFRYGRGIFWLLQQPNFSDILDLCLHWVSVVHVNMYISMLP